MLLLIFITVIIYGAPNLTKKAVEGINCF